MTLEHAAAPAAVPDVIPENYSDDETIRFVQGTRRRVINEIMVKGVPEDNESRNTVLRALEGSASTALANKRLRGDQAGNENAAKSRDMFFALLAHLGGKDAHVVENAGERKVHVPDVLLPGVEPVPGETDQGVQVDTFDEFAERHDLL